MRTISLLILGNIICFCLYSQNVNIPDANFKAAILAHDPVIDTDGDGEISIIEAESFKGTMDVTEQSITDLTGIESFKALSKLTCGKNQLTELNLNNNIQLTHLSCADNQLTSLDLKNNFKLTALGCSGNFLTELDVSNNVNLSILSCNDNKLTALDVNNTAIYSLHCRSNQLTTLDVQNIGNKLFFLSCEGNNLNSLDVSENGSLSELNCSENNLSSLNLGKNRSMNVLEVSNNLLTSLDLTESTALTSISVSNNLLTELNVSNNANLVRLRCDHNEVSELDVSQINVLEGLSCNNNKITTLNLRNNSSLISLDCRENSLLTLKLNNGNNQSMESFSAIGNPNLYCVQLDNTEFIEDFKFTWGGEFSIDKIDVYTTENCDDITAVSERYITNSIQVYPNPTTEWLKIEGLIFEGMQIQIFNSHGKKVQSGKLNLENKVSVRGLSAGTYVFKVIDGETLATNKFVIR